VLTVTLTKSNNERPDPEPHEVALVIISPVRDEALHIRHTLDSVIAQTCRPREWIIIDDGSTDETAAIVAQYAENHAFIRLHSRPDRGARKLGGGVIEAFDFGREQIEDESWRYIAKLDGDMSFGPRYLEIMLARLEAEPDLAAVSGKVYRPEAERLVLEYQIDEQVAGQFKLYKREAFEAIGGFEQSILWDGIDIHRCRMEGWRTLSFDCPEARLYHHRQMGSSDVNVYRGRLRLGAGLHFMGYDPLYLLASGIFRMGEKPYVIGGLLMIFAYFRAKIMGAPQYDDAEFRRSLQVWQRERLRRILTAPLRRIGLLAR